MTDPKPPSEMMDRLRRLTRPSDEAVERVSARVRASWAAKAETKPDLSSLPRPTEGALERLRARVGPSWTGSSALRGLRLAGLAGAASLALLLFLELPGILPESLRGSAFMGEAKLQDMAIGGDVDLAEAKRHLQGTLPSIAACIDLAERPDPLTPVAIDVRPNGKPGTVELVASSPRVQECLRSVVRSLRFSAEAPGTLRFTIRAP